MAYDVVCGTHDILYGLFSVKPGLVTLRNNFVIYIGKNIKINDFSDLYIAIKIP